METLKIKRAPMKPVLMLLVLWLLCVASLPASAQSNEVQQLLLNVEKLTQLKSILTDMEKGYQLISTGYNAVKNISQGNFSLHQVFLDGLMLVSPEVRKYRRIVDIIDDQKAILKEYSSAYDAFKKGDNFSLSELSYISGVYQNLLSRSLDDLQDLTTVITSSTLRMSDDERLLAIDRIYAEMEDKLQFLKSFNGQARLLNLQRSREKNGIQGLTDLFKQNP